MRDAKRSVDENVTVDGAVEQTEAIGNVRAANMRALNVNNEKYLLIFFFFLVLFLKTPTSRRTERCTIRGNSTRVGNVMNVNFNNAIKAVLKDGATSSEPIKTAISWVVSQKSNTRRPLIGTRPVRSVDKESFVREYGLRDDDRGHYGNVALTSKTTRT